MEQDALVRFAEHGGVVVGVAGGDDAVVEGVQRFHRGALGVFLPQDVVGDAAVVVHRQAVAQQGRRAELAHQRAGELIEGVREDDQLEMLAGPLDEFHRAVQRVQGVDHLLDVRQAVAVLVEDAEPHFHQLVVVGNVPGGGAQLVDTGALGEVDPDFRNQHPFQIETKQFHDDPLGR